MPSKSKCLVNALNYCFSLTKHVLHSFSYSVDSWSQCKSTFIFEDVFIDIDSEILKMSKLTCLCFMIMFTAAPPLEIDFDILSEYPVGVQNLKLYSNGR